MTPSILRPLNEIDLVGLLLVLLGGWAFVTAIEWAAPRLALHLRPRLRFAILPWVPATRLLVILLVVVTATSMLVQPEQGALFAVLGSLGLALGFAFKDYVGSLIAGVVVLFERPYSVGDWVEIDGVYGEVMAMGLRTIEVVTPDDNRVAIPHARIWDSPIRNATDGKRELQCVVNFYLRPKHDSEVVRSALRDVALTSPYLSLAHPVLVLVEERPWATQYRVKAYPTDGRHQFHFASDVTVRGRSELARLGVRRASIPVAHPDVSS